MKPILIALLEPDYCTLHDLEKLQELLIASGTVQANGIIERMQRSVRIAYAYEETIGPRVPIAIAAIKRPDCNYYTRVFRDAGAPRISDPVRELGWVYVKPEFGGNHIATRLLDYLIYRDNQVFQAALYAVTGLRNEPMQICLERVGFRRAGNPYRSHLHDEDLVLYCRPSVDNQNVF